MGCGVEYRWHGSLFTRVTERYDAPNHGKLCKKGKFGHDFLNDPAAPAVDLAAAREAAQKLLSRAKNPVMRISPSLCGEAIDMFIEAAARRGIPVVAAGLESIDPGWAQLVAGKPAGCLDDEKSLILLIGDIGASNNVAFTEAFRRKRMGAAELWIAGHDDETARRAASRVLPDVGAAIADATRTGLPVEVWVNPEEAGAAVLKALLASRDRLRINVLWSTRNAGYLFPKQGGAQNKPDLLLDVGVEESANGTRRIAWGMKPGAQDLFVPLSKDLWIHGKSYPTGMPSVTSGNVDLEALRAAASLL
jgi:hypothetical protein